MASRMSSSASQALRNRGRYSARHADDMAPAPSETAQSMNKLWRAYQKNKTKDLRDRIIKQYLPIVRYNAERVYSRLPDEVDLEDLISAGLFGLMDAIDAFDLSRKVKFETFCAQRVRGAILDELRAMDWVPRLVRQRSSRVENARQSIEKQHGRGASDDEIREKLGATESDWEKIHRDSSAVMTISITRRPNPQADAADDMREIDVPAPMDSGDPLRTLQRSDLRELITQGLTRCERLIVILYYFEGLTMKEIGATLSLSESRVSQMHTSVIMRLKSQLFNRERELDAA